MLWRNCNLSRFKLVGCHEYQDDNGKYKLQKVINCPEIQDTDNYGDAGHHGPFSTTDEVVDYLKKLKTINFD